MVLVSGCCGSASLTSELSTPVDVHGVFPSCGSDAWALQILPQAFGLADERETKLRNV